MLRLQRIQAIDPPTVRNQNSLYNLIRNSGSQTSTELEWIFNREDLAALATTQDNGKFNAFIQDSMFKISKPLTTWLFQTKEQRYMSGNEPSLIMLSPRRFNLFISIIITTLSSLLLLAPVALLYNFPDWGGWQILLIFAFTLIFATVCAAVTRAKRHEIFAATAAYCAVLVVFLANSAQFVVLPNGQPLSPATTHRLKLS